MLKEKEAFFRFIKGNECSSKDFNLAVKYYQKASFHERKLFHQKQRQIVMACCDVLNHNKTNDLGEVRHIYQKFGLSEDYFKAVFHFFIPIQRHYEEDEKIFEAAKLALWDKDKLSKIAQQYRITQAKLSQIISDYAFYHYKIKADDLRKYKAHYKDFRKFLALEKMSSSQKRNAYTYYQRYATPDEKEEFFYVVQNFLVKIIGCSKDTKKEDDFLRNAHLSDYDLYFFTKLENIDINVKEHLWTRFKKYYDGCLQYNFTSYKIEKEARALGLMAEDYIYLAKVYARDVLHIDEIEKKEIRSFSNPIYDVLESIKDETDLGRIENVLDEANVKIGDISVFCYCVHAKLAKEEQKNLERKLLTCLQAVHQKRIEDAKKMKKNIVIDYSKYYEYLSQKLNFRDYCASRGLDVKYFKRAAKTLKNESLRIQIDERIKKEDIEYTNKQIYWCKQLVAAINAGITINGVYRKFNLFDYFYYFGEYQIHRFFLAKLPLLQEDKTTLYKFFAPLKNVNLMRKDVILHSVFEYQPQIDENGNPIRGTGRVLQQEELQEIINIFDAKNIPFYDVLINMATRCYANHLFIDEIALQKRSFSL